MLEDSHASIIIEEKNFNKELLVSTIDSVLNDKDKLLSLKENTSKFGVRNSATRIYSLLKDMIDGE